MEAIKADFVSPMAYKEQPLLTGIRNLRDASQWSRYGNHQSHFSGWYHGSDRCHLYWTALNR